MTARELLATQAANRGERGVQFVARITEVVDVYINTASARQAGHAPGRIEDAIYLLRAIATCREIEAQTSNVVQFPGWRIERADPGPGGAA